MPTWLTPAEGVPDRMYPSPPQRVRLLMRATMSIVPRWWTDEGLNTLNDRFETDGSIAVRR
jgi:hypothetical protein